MYNLTNEYILLGTGIIVCLASLGVAVKVFKSKKSDNYLLLALSALGAFLGGSIINTNCQDISNEKHAVYNQTQDTLVVTGAYPSVSHHNHVYAQHREYEYNHISAIDKNNQEYSMMFYVDGKEPTFVERNDTIVVKFQYRNGERMIEKDSIVANLTRNRLINQIVQKNNQNIK